MKLPRWTTYPAIFVLLAIAIIGLPRGSVDRSQSAASRARSGRVALTAAPATQVDNKSFARSVVEFLPPGYVTDGSVDYRAQVQAAIHGSAGGTLTLPDFPIRIGRAQGANYGLIVRDGMRIAGSSAAELVASEGGFQLLRAENINGLVLSGFTIRGIDSGGSNLAHGLVQVSGGSDLSIRGLKIVGADADGLAISEVSGVIVEGCTIERASKSGIYLAGCDGAIVRGNIVRNFGGHLLAGNKPVGTGVQLSSSSNVVCSDNVISSGIGIGILCNANSGGKKPSGNILRGNRITSVKNSDNIAISGGIRCANGASDKATCTLVSGNSLRDCGVQGIYMENHSASAVIGNLVVESVRTGILVSTIQDLQVLDNVVLNSDTSQNGGQSAIYLINHAERVRCAGNVTRNVPLLAAARALETVKDTSNGGGHSIEPRIDYAASMPSQGTWRTGDIVYNSKPTSGAKLGWVCTASGQPGAWSGFGLIE